MASSWDDLFPVRMREDVTQFLSSKTARAIKRVRNNEGRYNIAQYTTKEELFFLCLLFSRIRTSVAIETLGSSARNAGNAEQNLQILFLFSKVACHVLNFSFILLYYFPLVTYV